MQKYQLKLYVTGRTMRSERAIRNLEAICRDSFGTEYSLRVIDVLESPQEAEEDKILATPTLIKTLPPPIRRIVGDLSEREKVLVALEVNARTEEAHNG